MTTYPVAIVRFDVPGFHCWPEAPGARNYLAQRHRHLFHVEVQLELRHHEREVEFHDLLDFARERMPGGEMEGRSCETMASELLHHIHERYPGRTVRVSVFEDGEVGASLEHRPRLVTCTRRLSWSSAHRVMRHESKCAHLHGHNYQAEITCTAPELDSVGRVIDFGVIKERVGAWIDTHWDHGGIYHEGDHEILQLSRSMGWKVAILPDNPTAEVLARVLMDRAQKLLADAGIRVCRVMVEETDNCSATVKEAHHEL